MPTRVTITGTGTPIHSADRAGAGVLIETDSLRLQFDAGRGTASRLFAAGVTPNDLDAIFLTHYHSDHLLGLDDLVLSRWIMDLEGSAPVLPLVAPNGSTTRFCRRMFELWDDDLAVRAHHNGREPSPRAEIVGFDAPSEPEEVWASGDVRVLAGQVRHEPVKDAVGYRIETPDGVVAISGDTLVCDEFKALASGAAVVVHEAMRMDVIMQRPPNFRYITEYHADTRLIGAQMAELGVPTLLLTHLIPGPADDDEKQAFVDEVRSGGYEGRVVVCDDLDAVELRR